MKVELKEEAINVIVGLLKQSDPTGFYTGGLADNIIDQHRQWKIEQNTPPEDRVIIKKIEEEIRKESNQPDGGAWGNYKEYKERTGKLSETK